MLTTHLFLPLGFSLEKQPCQLKKNVPLNWYIRPMCIAPPRSALVKPLLSLFKVSIRRGYPLHV